MDDILVDVKIPAKTPVYIVPWLLHHHPKYWKQPEDFLPDRFMSNASHGDAPSDFVYIPFGRGKNKYCAIQVTLNNVQRFKNVCWISFGTARNENLDSIHLPLLQLEVFIS